MEYSTCCFFLFNPTGCTFLQHGIREVKPKVVPPFFPTSQQLSADFSPQIPSVGTRLFSQQRRA